MKLSIVIPAFNVEHWIGETLDSVLSQDVPADEVIVVDDGSRDDTAGVVRRFGTAVTLWSQENQGLSAARNAGARRSHGDVVLFLDGDDRLQPGAIGHSLEILRDEPSAGVLIPNHRYGPHGRLAWSETPSRRILHRDDLGSLLRRNWVLANAFVKRPIWEAHPFDPQLPAVEDLDFFVRILLDEIDMIVAGRLGVTMTVGREGSLTSDTRTMRIARNHFFRKIGRDPRLTPSERALVAWQRARTRIGVAAAGRHALGVAARGEDRVLNVLLDEPGGGPRHVATLQEGLKDNFDVTVMSLDRRRLGPNLLGWASVARDIARAVHQQRPGVIHAHGIRAAAAVALIARFHRGTPKVVTVHGLHSFRRGRPALRALIGWANRRVLRAFDRVIVLGPSDQASVLDHRLARPEVVRVILPGVSFSPTRSSKASSDGRDVTVLWAGRFVPQKDPLAFVRAAQRSSDPGTNWVMAGEGELLEVCRAEALASVTFVGWQDDMDRLLRDCDVFVSTSRWEGFPLALVEAAVAGLPVIATDAPGNRDLLDVGVPIQLVPVGDAAALAHAIHDLVVDRAERERKGRETAAAARSTFAMDKMIEETRAVYSSLMPGISASSA